jgi:hypothetical protein
MASLPFDRTRIDFTRIDFTNVDLTDFDVAAFIESDPGRVARAAIDLAVGAVRESTYVTVGLTVLGIQRLQVRRREIQRALRS